MADLEKLKTSFVSVVSPASIHQNAVEHGWWDDTRQEDIPKLLCLIHSEVSEALEGYRNNIRPGMHGWLGEELADVVIRVFDMAEGLNIDILEEIRNKHCTNLKRPHRHGGKRC